MTRVIYKYVLPDPTNKILMPNGATILTVQLQGDAICLWAEVDPDSNDQVERTFTIYGTGHDLSETPRKYIGTVQVAVFVWHVFEEWGA